MVMLVSLQQASDHLRRDTDSDDADLLLKIKAASKAIIRYLGVYGTAFLNSADEVDVDSADEPIGVPEDVQMATLVLIQTMYDGEFNKETWSPGYLPTAVVSLLYPTRDPTVA